MASIKRRSEPDLQDYLKLLREGTPLYQKQYNFRRANEYVRFPVDEALQIALTRERDRFPKFDPHNLATVDVHQLFAQHKDFYTKICKIVARSVVEVESIRRGCPSDSFYKEFIQEACDLQKELYNAIPLAPILPTSSAMDPSQYCLACIIADVSNVVTNQSIMFQYMLSSVLYTGGMHAWLLFQPEALVAIVEHFKVLLTGEVSLDNKDGTWAKITYIESGEVKSNPVPITTATRSIIIGHDLEVAPTSDKLVLELNNVYHAHPVAPNDKMTKARTNVPTIRLDFIDNTIIWLSTRDKSATHNSYFQQPKKVQIDEAGFRSRGPMYHLM
uniref:Crinkler (CRN) family protein n=1 Tax=Panagrellus redivivus TaxID=6233 RepID=A0A7E4ZUA5_PANRE